MCTLRSITCLVGWLVIIINVVNKFDCFHDNHPRYTNEEVVLKYARWALERDEKIAVKIFTDRRSQEQPSERMRPDSVLHFLSPFATATVNYLEYLVCDKGLKVSQLWESASYRIFPRGMKTLCVKGAWKFKSLPPFLPILWPPSPYFVTPFPHLLSSVLCK